MLEVPQLLYELLASGRWPRDASEAQAQNLKPLVALERLRALAPEEQNIFLFPPPFSTVRQQCAFEEFWTWPVAAPDGIDFDLALVIGDFGLGSDAPILLDYREDAANPRVLRLRWSAHGRDNKWVLMAPDFRSFVDGLGI
jgi:hypothetical protein